jgi:uncharacterized protein
MFNKGTHVSQTLFSFYLLAMSAMAGLLGALTGLGGGIIVIPALVLVFNIDLHYAMGAALISVIATSSGTAMAYLKQGYTNLRIGMFLELGAVIGAVIGASLIAYIPAYIIMFVFSAVLFLSAYLTIHRQETAEPFRDSHPWAKALQLDGQYPIKPGHYIPYHVQHVPTALIIMTIAGALSGLLGIGSGTLKVLAMDQAMRLPYKVATTTSNFMIGITAAVSAGIYFRHGYILPNLAFPIMLGVIVGAFFGAKLLPKIKTHTLRLLFSAAITLLGIQMIYKALSGIL